MPKVKNIEKKIWDVEGFDVNIIHPDGRDLRGDFSGLTQQYSYDRAAKNSLTVEAWKENRFRPIYPGFDINVLDADGTSCQGNTLLANVRDTYVDE